MTSKKTVEELQQELDDLQDEIARRKITGITIRNRGGWYAVAESDDKIVATSNRTTLTEALLEVLSHLEPGEEP